MLDRTRNVVERRLGVDPVDPNAVFEEGDLLHWSTDGWTKSTDGTADVLRGIAGLNKQNVLYGTVIDEAIVLTDEDDVALAHANLVDGSQRVADASGSAYTETTDYTLNDTNGIIARVNTGSIGDGETVYVSYTYQRTETEIEEDVGKNISNTLDETYGVGNIVVYRGDMRIATNRYDTSQAYAVNAALYDAGNGLLTTDSTGGVVAIGHVHTPPTASDPWLIADLSL